MSAGPGTEAVDAGLLDPDEPTMPLAVVTSPAVDTSPPVVPRAVPRPSPPPTPSGVDAWLRALRPTGLTTALLPAVLAGLLLVGSDGVSRGLFTVAVAGLVVVHVLVALLRALADPGPGRAGPLRRVEAGRALLATAVVAVALTVALTAVRGWPALGLAAGAAGCAVLLSRAASVRVLLGAPAGAVLAVAGTWWAATGSLPWLVLVAALPLAVLAGGVAIGVSAGQSTGPQRPAPPIVLVAPYVAVGAAVALQALPWPALIVALALPVARRGAVASGRQPAAGHARLVAALLLVGTAVAAGTGTDVPLAGLGLPAAG